MPSKAATKVKDVGIITKGFAILPAESFDLSIEFRTIADCLFAAFPNHCPL